MSQSKASERPTLQGQRIKTRKRDEKEKYDPQGFRDTLLAGIKETNGDLELLSKYLDAAGSKLDYRRYGEPLCDILIAGGLLAPGGTLILDTSNQNSAFAAATAAHAAAVANQQAQQEKQAQKQEAANEKAAIANGSSLIATNGSSNSSSSSLTTTGSNNNIESAAATPPPLVPQHPQQTILPVIPEPAPKTAPTTDVCVFGRPSDEESLRAFTQVFVRLIRRYKYLEKSLEEDLKKIVVFLRAFTPDDRLKLAKVFAYLLASGHITVSPLKTLLEQDLLVKEGLAFQLLLVLLAAWQQEKDAPTVWAALRKSGLDSKMLDFLPKSKRSQEAFSAAMLDSGLGQLLEYQKAQRVETLKKELSGEITNQMQNENAGPTELISIVRDYMNDVNNFTDSEVTIILWNTLMSQIEWSKKEELVADQAVKHLRTYIPLLVEFCKSPKAELALLLRVQDYCYENMNFLKAFQKIVLLFYKNDVISEDVILRWYKKDHSAKGKSIFLEQMKKFIDWLVTAEEEGSDEE